MSEKMISIKMTEEQQLWLLRRMKIDWDEEVNYQKSNEDSDTSYLEELKACYVAILGKPKHTIEAMANEEIVKSLEQDIEDVKELDRLWKEQL